MADVQRSVSATFDTEYTYMSKPSSPPQFTETELNPLLRQSSNGSEYVRAYRAQFPSLDAQTSPREDSRRCMLERAARFGGAWSVQMVLSLDGGGIRGLSTLLIIKDLMRHIKEIERSAWPYAQTSGDCEHLDPGAVQTAMQELQDQFKTAKGNEINNMDESSFLPCHYFDYIAGTSTGSLIATMLGRMWMSADRALIEFQKLTRKVYGLRNKTLARTIRTVMVLQEGKVKNIVKDSFGDKLLRVPDTMDTTRCKTILCSFEQGSRKRGRVPYVFRSYKPDAAVQSVEHGSEEHKVADVMRATACSPYSLNLVKLGHRKFCDAGLSWTNPTGEVCKELSRQWSQDLPPCLMLSIGSGYNSKQQKPPKKHSNPWNYHNIRMEKTTYRVNSALLAISEGVHEFMEKLWEQEPTLEYVRLNAELDLGPESLVHSWQDEVKTLYDQIQRQTEVYLGRDSVRSSLRQCAETLVELRRQRSRTTTWEAFAFGVKYQCRYEDCAQASERFDQFQLANHLRQKHLGQDQQYADDDKRIKHIIETGRKRSDD